MSLDTADLITQSHLSAQVELLYRMRPGFHPFLGLEASSLSFAPSPTLEITPKSLSPWNLGIGAILPLSKNFQLRTSIFWQNALIVGQSTSTNLPISTVGLPGAEFAMAWNFWERGDQFAGISAGARYLLGGSTTVSKIQASLGYGGKLHYGMQWKTLTARLGVLYETLPQNTTIQNQNILSTGVELGLEFPFAAPEPRPTSYDQRVDEEKKRKKVKPIPIASFKKQKPVSIRITRLEGIKKVETFEVTATWKWGRYNDLPCLTPKTDRSEITGMNLCLTKDSTFIPVPESSKGEVLRFDLPFRVPVILVSTPCEDAGVKAESTNLQEGSGIVAIHCMPNLEERVITSKGLSVEWESVDDRKQIHYEIKDKSGASLGSFIIHRSQ